MAFENVFAASESGERWAIERVDVRALKRGNELLSLRWIPRFRANVVGPLVVRTMRPVTSGNWTDRQRALEVRESCKATHSAALIRFELEQLAWVDQRLREVNAKFRHGSAGGVDERAECAEVRARAAQRGKERRGSTRAWRGKEYEFGTSVHAEDRPESFEPYVRLGGESKKSIGGRPVATEKSLNPRDPLRLAEADNCDVAGGLPFTDVVGGSGGAGVSAKRHRQRVSVES